MKIVLLLLTFTNVLILTSAAFRAPWQRSEGNVESLSIPPNSRVYIQVPGDSAFSGILNPTQERLRRPGNLPVNQVLVRLPNNNNLMTNLGPFVNNQNYHVRGYRCFIRTTEGTILRADLEPYTNQENVRYRVFVRLPIEGNNIFTGILHNNEGFLPVWLRFHQ